MNASFFLLSFLCLVLALSIFLDRLELIGNKIVACT